MDKLASLKRSAIILAVVIFTLAPVFAFAIPLEGRYLNINGGAVLQPNITYHATNNSVGQPDRYLATETKSGKALDFSYGFQTEDLRAEISAVYLKNKIKKAMMRSTGFDIQSDLDKGTTQAIGLMANGLYDFDNGADFTPYVGLGIGFVRVSHQVNAFPRFSGSTVASGTMLTVNDPPVTVTTTTGNSTITKVTYTQTVTKTTTSLVNNVTSASPGVTPLVGVLPPPVATVGPPQSIAFLSTYNSPGVIAPFGPTSTYLTDVASYSTDARLQFAYQTLMGVSYKVMDLVKLSLDYRYLKALPSTFKVMDAGVSVPMRASYSSHRLMLGFTAFF